MATANVPQLMVKDLVVWNKSCGGSVDNQKLREEKEFQKRQERFERELIKAKEQNYVNVSKLVSYRQ